METIKIGKIVNVRGLKGEVKVYAYTEAPERFEELDYIYVGQDAHEIEKVTYHKGMPVLKLSGIDTVDAAQKVRNRDVFIDKDQVRPLEEGEYLIIDLIGCEVVDSKQGVIGTLVDILTHTAQHVYVVKTPTGEKLIPAVAEFVKKIDLAQRRIEVELIEGF